MSKAAERISISRQALSKTISFLEQSLGKQLFYRKQNGVEPTPAAIEIYSHVKVILREYNRLTSPTKMETLNNRRVRVCTIDALSQVFPNSFYETFYASYPDILLTLEETQEKYAIEQLLTNDCDFAIVSDQSNYYEFNHTFLFHAEYGSYMSINHPLASKDPLSLSDFHNIKFVGKTMRLEYYNKFNHMDDGVIFKTVKEMGNGIDLYFIENKSPNALSKNAMLFKQYLLNWFESNSAS